MQYQEYGTENKETIMLLHGGGLSWWNYRAEAELLRHDYHVILPVLDGHADSDRPFSSIESNAAEIIRFIDEQLGGRVLLIGGLSLGGQILLEMLAQRADLCRFAVIESAMTVPARLTHVLIAPVFGSSYALIRNERFARLQFRSLHMNSALFRDYYRDTCQIEKRDMIAFMKANTAYALRASVQKSHAELHAFIGEKETRGIKRSAAELCKAVPSCRLTVLPGLYHGEFSVNHPAQYAETVRSIVQEQPYSVAL